VMVSELRSQFPTGIIGVPETEILLSWTVEAHVPGLRQLTYEIEVSNDHDFSSITSSTKSESDRQVEVAAPGGPVGDRESRYYRVRIQTEKGWSGWSPILNLEGSIDPSKIIARAIGDNSKHSDPVTLLRREFHVASTVSWARLYMSAEGLYEARLNGVEIADERLNPGWTAYDNRFNLATFDVTNHILTGANCLSLELADGWFRGKMGFMNMYDNYGEHTSVIAQLEVELESGESFTLGTDSSFKVSQGSVRFADIYDGCSIDLTRDQPGWRLAGFDDSGWESATEREFDLKKLSPRIAEPIRTIHEFPMKPKDFGDRVLLDASQNVSGWVRLVVDGKKGQRVVIRHAEVLEPGEKLHTKALRDAKATDEFVLARDGRVVLVPKFTFHGFQYAEVVTEAQFVSAEAVAISSDAPTRSFFSSSDTRLNKLHSNVYWSQRDNFVGVPTDCPQRDERLGWTGDAQAFSYAANTLVEAEAFWRSWLIDLELDQEENGDVGAVIPDLLKKHPLPSDEWIMTGRAGWADAATIVPVSVYERFGSEQILRQQLNSMRRWVDALHNRREGHKYLPTQFQFGDWCDPDAPSDRPWEAKVSADFVANAFFAHSTDLLAKVESLVGDQSKQTYYQQLADELKQNLWADMRDEALNTTAGAAMALEFQIVPADQRESLASDLAEMVRKDNGKITTGFLGTPLILDALSKNGHISEAYLMLMRREIRSWLYQVDMGATTIWERWDAIKENGEIHAGEMDTANDSQSDESMISFNHYAYGAVIDWVYRNVAGIAPADDSVGYKTFKISPSPAEGFNFCEAGINSPYGEIWSSWKLNDSGYMEIKFKVPFGTTAELSLPVQEQSVIWLDGEEVHNGTDVGNGSHQVLIRNPMVVNYA
ncbi:MAG TPA: family 78 glycoside hydrolase catalytic domain, partial [Microbacteriaceae bacterium]